MISNMKYRKNQDVEICNKTKLIRNYTMCAASRHDSKETERVLTEPPKANSRAGTSLATPTRRASAPSHPTTASALTAPGRRTPQAAPSPSARPSSSTPTPTANS